MNNHDTWIEVAALAFKDETIQTLRQKKVIEEVGKSLAIILDESSEELFSCPESSELEYTFMMTIPSDVIGLVIRVLKEAGRNPRYDAVERRIRISLPVVTSECQDVDVLNTAPTTKVNAL